MTTFDIALLGSGWLGLPLVRHFKLKDLQVAASTRQLNRFPEIEAAGAIPFLIDIDNRNDRATFFNCRVLIVNITSKNIISFQYLISQIEDGILENVLLVSSSSVYQNLQREVSEDEAAENPDSVLFQIEQLFRGNPNFQTTILRCSGLIDGRRHPGRFFRHGKKLPQPNAPVNLVHLDDVIGIIDAIIAQQAWGEVFNASADTHPSKREFYCYARKLLGLPAPDCADDNYSNFKIVSNNKVKQQLGYRFSHPDLMQIQF
ncbi:MAG: SDR family NAD(P)-dependent oxidoreductase [Methylophaga sp.]|nr:SDR family NAD(P)-dependent oxidoreductase [Methylophaga sp.]